ncbi:hypothetical protein GQ42DRAFT_161949 [Ramicandelaber brevisporus]|nr:hypothetical protein GQ42DRAFT_161949 [Ramicandelaber brevisporus]
MTSHHSHSSGILQNGEESNAFEGSGGERHRGAHNIAPSDARMDIRQYVEAMQPNKYIELLRSMLEESAERDRFLRKLVTFWIGCAERSENENKQLRAENERLNQELAEAHRQAALAYTHSSQQSSTGFNASRSASPSPWPYNARGSNIRNVNHDGLTHSIIRCSLEEMFGLKAGQNKHRSGIGHGSPGAGQAGGSVSSDANPFWIGTAQQRDTNNNVASVDADESVATDLSATADSSGPEFDLRNSGKGARASSKRGVNASNTQQQKESPATKRRKTVQSQTPATASATATVRRSQRIKMKQSATTAGEEQSLD